jgi:type IV pilus assembly protein PilN
MRVQVNLATRPFVELGPFFLRLRLIMVGLALLAVGLMVWQHFDSQKLLDTQRDMDALRRETIAAQREKLNNEARMSQPQNAAVLARAHFLNALFQRKSFSWTAVMMDLERVLPTGVQVTAIDPQITADGDVIIHLRVAGDRDRAIQLVRNLEHSSRFLRPRLSSETTQNKEQAAASAQVGILSGVDFDILANYNPLPEPVQRFSAGKEVVDAPDSDEHISAQGHVRRHTAAGAQDGVVLKPYDPAHPVTPRYLQPTPARQNGGTR